MKYICALIASVALLSGCSVVSVSRDYDPSADFSSLSTYAWKYEKQPVTGNPRIDNDLVDQRVRAAVDAELEAKGFERAERSNADCLVAYFIEYKRRISGNTWVFGLGSGMYDGYGGIGYNTAISDYDEGFLTIDVIDRPLDKTIWRGVGQRATYEAEDPGRVTEIIGKAVSRILADFPPKGRK